MLIYEGSVPTELFLLTVLQVSEILLNGFKKKENDLF